MAGLLLLFAGSVLLWKFGLFGRSTKLVDLWKISDGRVDEFAVYMMAVGLLVACWIWSMRLARGWTFSNVWLPVIGVTIPLYVVFLLVYPATAIDVYIYAARSQLLTDWGLNPSVALPRDLWDIDPFVQYASWEWSDRPSPYGPLWNIVAAPATAIGDDSILRSVVTFKTMMAAAAAGIGWLIYDIGKRTQPALALSSMLAWLWSPVVLWEGIANSHNDVLLVLLVVGALWCWHRGYLGLVIPLLGASALLKVVTVIAMPVALAAIVARTGWNKRLLTLAAQTAGWSAGVLWIAFAPFYDLRGVIEALNSQRGIWVTSPIVALDAMNSAWSWGLDLRPAFDRFATLLIVALTAGGTAVAWKRPSLLPRVIYEQLFWLLLLATSNLRPWYVIWLVGLAAVLPMGMPLVRAVAWAVGALGSYVYTGWIQNWTEPAWLERIAINVTITLGPVTLVLLLSLWRLLHERTRTNADHQPSSA